MKRTIGYLLLMVVGSVLFQYNEVAASTDGPSVLKLKGLYLGMSIDDACPIVSALLHHSYAVQTATSYDERNTPYFCGSVEDISTLQPGLLAGTYQSVSDPGMAYPAANGVIVSYPRGITIRADASRRVVWIDISISGSLFNTQGIEGADFVRAFAKSYDIDPASFELKEWHNGFGAVESQKVMPYTSCKQKSGVRYLQGRSPGMGVPNNGGLTPCPEYHRVLG